MEEIQEVIAAFVDDERVDAEALKRALARPEGRDYLVELLALRELVTDRAASAPVVQAAARRSLASRFWPVMAAGVLLTVSTLAGYRLGYRIAQQAPASITRPAASSSAPANVQLTAPAPTKVIRLQPGVDWTEREGGH